MSAFNLILIVYNDFFFFNLGLWVEDIIVLCILFLLFYSSIFLPNKITYFGLLLFHFQKSNFRIKPEASAVMAKADLKPKSIRHAKNWSDEVENLYRFQQAGYRDEFEYKQVKQVDTVRFGTVQGLLHYTSVSC